jgi:hypothetical protein
LSFQKYKGMDGMGWVQTSSPTSPNTGSPASFQASTAQPSSRHCMTPGSCGSSRWPPTKAPAKSVPPEMLHHQMSVPMALNWSTPQLCVSADRGEPVVPNARTRDKSPLREMSKPALWQLAKYAAPAPKNVTRSCAAMRHKMPQSGLSLLPPGLPS